MSSLVEFNFPRKDPQEVLAYGVDWSQWLDEGETIQSYTVTANGVDIYSHTLANNSTQINVTLQNGVAGELAVVHFRVTSSTGLVGERTVNIEIVEK